MTREEAIKMLNRLLLSCDECPHHDCEECDIALNMAIQTLQEQRQEILPKHCIVPFGDYVAIADVPKRGKWLPENADVPTYCSVCGHSWDEYIYGSEIWYTGDLPHFCPNCNADMRGNIK